MWYDVWLCLESGSGEVLVCVWVCGLNNMDVNMWLGWYLKMVEFGMIGGVLEVDFEDVIWGGVVVIFLCI